MRDPDAVVGQARTPVFVGRAEELVALDGLLRTAGGGEPAVVLVAGEAGMGKSRLAAELRARAGAAGAVLATGRTPVGGEALPYGPVVGLARDLARRLAPREAEELLEPVQRLLAGPAPGVTGSGALARLQLFEAALRLVEGLARDRLTVLVLEDIHWADAGSIELLDYLVRNLDDQAVLIAATFRPDEVERRPPVRRVLMEMRRHPRVTALELRGLSRDEVAALLAAVTGEAQSWAVVDAVHRRSEGNPLFTEELIGLRDSTDLPPALRELLAVRIEQLPPDARAVVGAASVLGVSTDHRLLARVAALEPAALDAAVAEAARSGVLVAEGRGGGRVRFRHALLRDAAHTGLLPAERVVLHRRAADAVMADPFLAPAGPGHAAAALAEHRFEAGEWAAACRASLDAARASLGLNALSAAHSHLRRAVDAHRLAAGSCTHDDVDEAELYRMSADVAFLVGESDESVALAAAALDSLAALGPSVPPARLVACTSLFARCTWHAGDHDSAFAALSSVTARLGGTLAAADAADVVGTQARLLMLTGRSAEALPLCREALALARGSGARLLEGHTLATLGACLAQTGDLDAAVETLHEAVRVAEEVAEPDLLLRAYTNLTHIQYLTGRLAEAAALAIDAMRDTSPIGTVRLGGTGFNAGMVLIHLGRWDEAAQLLRLLDGKASAACANDSLNAALLAVRRGDLAAAEAELDRRVPTAPRARAERDELYAEIALERGHPDDAAAAVDRALTALAGTDYTIEILTAHALGLRALADRAARPVRPGRRNAEDRAKTARQAESMLAEVESCIAAATPDGPHGRGRSPWIDALGAQCRAEATRALQADPDAWAAATRAWQMLPAPFQTASCRLREAEALLAARADRRRATDALVDAWRMARRLGAAGLAAGCERLADRARIALDDPHDDGATPRSRAAADLGLTSREVDVLELLARGRTDAQIAAELFVSKKTASVHVSNILRKLDARDRWHAGDIGRTAGLGPAG